MIVFDYFSSLKVILFVTKKAAKSSVHSCKYFSWNL